MRRGLPDTLFLRLFLLMWLALVGSHVLAFLAGTWFMPLGLGPGEGPHIDPFAAPLPTFPSLPPVPGQGPPGSGAMDRPGGMPWRVTVVDYSVRLLVIGVAAWWGARWLSAPMRRLSIAAGSLGATLGGDAAAVPLLDASQGTVEVRGTARIFNEMAGQLQRQFRARGLLVAALSHDLRTPLTRMRMRLARLPDDPWVARCVHDIRDMNELIDSALALFRDTSAVGAMQSTDICSVVQSLTDDLVELGQPVRFQGEPAVADCQPVLLRRVVGNLVSNAVRYGRQAEVRVLAGAQAVQIVVEDSGPGIPPAQLAAVFEPFVRLGCARNRDTGGVGLGLYIARDLITRQGGTLTLSNRPSGGLQACVCLPVPAR